MTKKILQYSELAKYYDLLYDWKDYRKEARILLQLIKRYKQSSGNSLLDVGCGTGKHIEQLQRRFDCVGIDASEEMLKQARRNVNGTRFVRANMISFNLKQKFDVVLCLFSGIGYVRTYPKLARTLRNFARHLRDGGVVIIEPWLTKAAWTSGRVHLLSNQKSDELKVVRVDFTGIRGNLSVIDMRTLVAEKGKGISYYKDIQMLGLFERAKFLKLMRKAGFEGKYIKRSLARGRGLYIGIKSSTRSLKS